jgi:hypothetical protein
MKTKKERPEAPGRRLGDGGKNLTARVRDIRAGLGADPSVAETRILARAFLRSLERSDEELEEISAA